VTRRLRAVPSLESLFVAALVLFGYRLGARSIGDNSMFVHLRTGVDMARTGAIPRTDPYTFTAHGHSWVVQSWLPEWTYGWVDRIGGLRLVVVEQAVLMALMALLVARLARAGSPLRTALAAGVAVGAGAAYWTPRPLMFGLIAMALTVTVVERGKSPWLLVPVAWMWVSSHGSFPLALLWLGARGVGELADERRLPRVSLRYLWGFLAGLVVAVANPLGLKLLSFPLTVQRKESVFKTIVEWRSPDFQATSGLWTLLFLGLALVILLRARPLWRDVVPIVGFVALGLFAQRNLPLAAVVLAPALGRALRAAPAAAGPGGERRPNSPVNAAFLAVMALAVVVFTAGIYRSDPLSLRNYPVAAVSFLERTGLRGPAHRVAEQDVVGCYLDLRFGKRARTFVDDRYDMFPLRVSEDYAGLLKGRPDSVRILERYRVDVVLWDRSLPLVPLLRATGQWRQVHRSGDWVVLQHV
jgi:hypothetical protein